MTTPTLAPVRSRSPGDHHCIIRGTSRHISLVRRRERWAESPHGDGTEGRPFGPFEADLVTGELRRDGRRVQLQHQPFLVLSALLERPGELVTQRELRCRLWADGTHVSFDRGLASALRKLREALGDSAREPRYIETRLRRGYRFIAPVSYRPQPVERLPPAAIERRRPVVGRKTLRWAAAALLTIGLSGEGQFSAGTDARLSAADTLSAYACG